MQVTSRQANNRGGRKKGSTRASVAECKAEVLRLIGTGISVKQALEAVGRARPTYEGWRRVDPVWAGRVDAAREAAGTRAKGDMSGERVPDFPEFCAEYLNQPLAPHQLQWFDMLEGREPRGLHPAMEYEPGSPTRLMVNTPPGHAKSTTITVNYTVWRIVKNPAIRVIVVSKAQRLAEQFLLQIKERLTSPQYPRISIELAPPGGWDGDSAKWTANMFYVNASARDAEAKDPTVQALGIRGQVYGSRADLVILDDTVDTVNVAEYEKQIVWVLSMVASRLTPKTGRLLVIGTRIAAKDLYSELRDPLRYHSGKSPWTYLKQPAVLEFADDPVHWVTLWPKAHVGFDPDQDPDENGMYDRWDGQTLADVRAGLPPAEWSRVYQQQHVAERSVFPAEAVHACVGGYMCGALTDSTFGRTGGTDGLYIIAGLDPAVTGHTAAVCMGVDRRTSHRWVIDLFNKQGCTPDEIRELIQHWTDKHGISEWRIEKNAFQGFLTGDTAVRNFLASRGTVLTDHYTGKTNKFDPEFGVAAMANLFTQGLIHLPCVTSGDGAKEAAKQIIEQLITWTPGLKNRNGRLGSGNSDLVMALWFADLRAQEYVSAQSGGLFMDNKYATRGNLARRQLITIT